MHYFENDANLEAAVCADHAADVGYFDYVANLVIQAAVGCLRAGFQSYDCLGAGRCSASLRLFQQLHLVSIAISWEPTKGWS